MPRAIWSGSISSGLVNVPVKAYSAVRDHTVHFHQLEKGTGARIRYRKVSDETGDEVADDDIELGYEVNKGRYVTVDRDELAELRPESTRTIDVSDFVALDDIDPVYYDHTYWLAPDGDGATTAYRLLLAAMEERERVGIGTVVMRDHQYLAAIRPRDGALAMSTMRFADEVVPKSDVEGLPQRRAKPGDKELRLATQIVESLSTEWDPARYRDTYTDELEDLLRRRAEGEEVVSEPSAPEGAKVLDLMAALEASVQEARGGRRAAKKQASARRSAPRKAPGTKRSAKKASAKKATATRSPSRAKRPSKRSA